jgi:hypothetical protein
MPVATQQILNRLREFDFTGLMVEELGWNYSQANPLTIAVNGELFGLTPVAEKCGLVVYACERDGNREIPAGPIRQEIGRQVAATSPDHLVIIHDAARTAQYWQWVRRQVGTPPVWREQVYQPNQNEEPLFHQLQWFAFDLEEARQSGSAGHISV